MKLVKKIRSLFFSQDDIRSKWISVRCNKCGEIIDVRIDLYNQLSTDYDENGGLTGYFCRKVIVGNTGCFQRIEMSLWFDPKRNIVEKEISGGQFVENDTSST